MWTDDSNISWLLRSKSWVYPGTGSTTIYAQEIQDLDNSIPEMFQVVQEHMDYRI